LPKPGKLPRPELQKAPKIIPLPKVVEYSAATVSPWLAGLSASAGSLGQAITSFAGNNAGKIPGTTDLGNLPASIDTDLTAGIG
jgi:hypothetical protein